VGMSSMRLPRGKVRRCVRKREPTKREIEMLSVCVREREKQRERESAREEKQREREREKERKRVCV